MTQAFNFILMILKIFKNLLKVGAAEEPSPLAILVAS